MYKSPVGHLYLAWGAKILYIIIKYISALWPIPPSLATPLSNVSKPNDCMMHIYTQMVNTLHLYAVQKKSLLLPHSKQKIKLCRIIIEGVDKNKICIEVNDAHFCIVTVYQKVILWIL